MARQRSLIIAAAVTAAAVLYGAVWVWGAGQLRDEVELWAAARRADGWQITLGDVSAAGFPMRLAVTAANPAIVIGSGARKRAWRGPPVTVAVRPWQPGALRLGLAGTHIFETGTGDAPRHVAVSVERATATLENPGERLDLVLRNLVLPPDIEAPLGRTIAVLEFGAVLKGPLGAGDLKDAAASWRDGGGTVEVVRLALDWSALSLRAEGTVALDKDMQPMAALSARFTGFRETVDALVALGRIRPRDGMTAKIVLGLLAKAPEGSGEAPEIAAPLTVQKGKLYIGPVRLLSLPKIDWGR